MNGDVQSREIWKRENSGEGELNAEMGSMSGRDGGGIAVSVDATDTGGGEDHPSVGM